MGILIQTTTLGVGFKTGGMFGKQRETVSKEMWEVGDAVKETMYIRTFSEGNKTCDVSRWETGCD